MSFGFNRAADLEESRYNYLKEVVSEYLGDEGESPENLIRDVKRACSELKAYHAERLAAYNTVESQLEV